jgi:hypothetical protein
MKGVSARSHCRRSFRGAAARRDSTVWPRARSWLLESPMRSPRGRSTRRAPDPDDLVAAPRLSSPVRGRPPDRCHGAGPVPSRGAVPRFTEGALRQLRWLRALSFKKEPQTVAGPDQPSASVTGIMARRIAAR